MIATYAELKAAVEDIVHRELTATTHKTLISLTESRINREVRCLEMEQVLTQNITSNVVTLPSDFLELISVNLDGNAPVQVSTRYAQNMARFLDRLTYSINGNTLRLSKNTADTFELTLNYFAKPTALINDSDTNDVLKAYPNAYVYSMLLDYSFVSEDSRQAAFGEAFKAELESISDAYIAAKMSGSNLQKQG